MTESTAIEPQKSTTASTSLSTVPALFANRLKTTPDKTALKHKVDGKWVDVTWADCGVAVLEIAHGLRCLGVQPGDRVGVHSNTCIAWVMADIGIMSARAITVPVYPTCTAEDTTFILSHADVKVYFAETLADVEKIRSSPEVFPPNVPAILFTGEPSSDLDHSFESLRALGRKAMERSDVDLFQEAIRDLSADDVATIVFTSGTTGKPKGACLTHGNLTGECEGLAEVLEFTPDDMTLSFLPLAHIFARMIHILGIERGYTTAYAEHVNKVIENIGEIEPTFMASVPRVFEKIYAKIKGTLTKAPPLRRYLAESALEMGERMYLDKLAGKSPGLLDACLHPLAESIVLEKMRQKIFGRRMRYLVSGGAPMPVGIASFFQGMGVDILEGYGLTETTAATHVNRRDDIRVGFVGKAIKGVQTRIAPDGEIQVRGSVIMKGYYKNDEANEAAFANGWFCTGDIGEITDDDWLKITDRKKELIVTSAGKNIAPQKIEGILKTTALVSQAMVYGDKKNYLVSLISINADEVRAELKRRGQTAPEGPLSESPEVLAILESAVEEKNKHLARYETVKKIVLTDTELTPENGYLTPTLKLKRREIIKTFGEQLDKLYEDDRAGKD